MPLRSGCQFLPMRAALGSAVLENDPSLPHRHPARTTTPRSLSPYPLFELDVALVHMNRADQFGNAQYLGPDPYFDDLFCMAAKEAYVSTEQIIDTAGMTVDAAIQTMLLDPHDGRRWSRRPPNGGALHHVHADLRA